MSCYTPNSDVTFQASEAALQKILDAYRRARPEELRIVSRGYTDGDPKVPPLPLDGLGNSFDYAFRPQKVIIDFPPPDPGLKSPIPPKEGEFQVVVELASELKNFKDGNSFSFTLTLFVLCSLFLTNDHGKRAIALDALEVRIPQLGPDGLRGAFEHALLLVLKHALAAIRIPPTLSLDSVVRFIVFDLTTASDTLQIFGAFNPV